MTTAAERLAALASVEAAAAVGGSPYPTFDALVPLEKTELGLPGRAFRGVVPGACEGPAADALQQEVYAQLRASSFLADVVVHRAAGTPVVTPLPKRWRRAVAGGGVRVAPIRSRARWVELVLRSFVRGARSSKRLLAAASGLRPAAPYSVLVGAGRHSHFSATHPAGTADLLSWFRGSGLDGAAGDVWVQLPPRATPGPVAAGVQLTQSVLPALDDRGRRGFQRACARAAARALTDLLRGRWWTAVLLEQVVALRYLEAVEPSALATTYVFTNSDAVRRPLWTYAAEARGAGVVLVYYSVNNFPLSAAEGIRWNEGSGDCFLTWSDYRTMSPTHARHLEAVVRRPASVAVCELIDFSDDGEPVPAIPSPSCAAFDVVPFRATYRAERGALDAFYTSDLALRFLDDVHGVLANHGVAMVLKPKRSDNSFTDEGYLAALDRLAELPGVELVDPWIAPRRVAAATDMTISLVFTTPGLIAARLGRPSVFYDPSGALVGEMPTFDGVPVIGSRDDLDRWVASTLADLPAPGADTIAR